MRSRRHTAIIAALSLLVVLAFMLAGCGQSATSTSEDSQATLDAKAEREGVTFSINKSWKNNLDQTYGGVEPCSSNKITVTTFTNGEGESLEAADKAGVGLLGKASDYKEDESFDVSGGTTVTCYTLENDSGYLYSVALGNNSSTGVGFLVFFNRGKASDMGELNDATYMAIVKSIKFDPSKATAFVPSSSNSSSSSTASAAPSTSNNSSTTMTTGQANALAKAKSYLNSSHFSHDGLVEQLEYNKFSHEDAVYAADNCGADWNAQALGKAKDYLKSSAFSYSGLVDQLKYSGFSEEQATYAVDNCGADWMSQAAKKAQSYMDSSSFSRQGLIDQLEYSGFSEEQAVHGADSVGL